MNKKEQELAVEKLVDQSAQHHEKHVEMMHFVMAAGLMVKMDWRQTLRVAKILIEQVGDKPIGQVTLDELLNALGAWEREQRAGYLGGGSSK
ncbi:hypothetical protein GCM10011403_29510 [Pseudohongiella nitratireducens]|uniref:Uncharacterized protein n=1 Tax=Pseudohongiella nitratireducens TaxID=1768907 RepID=A0A916QPC7_9GAMM|nr:hypothetical protein [Pseudohongiella nitratireducens]GFZ84076.1 hypothetical protein GCM10011403_29510 [Pseudohongiella nitratireducens]